MAAKKGIWLFWSSGKDSAWSLHVLRRRPDVEVRAMVATVNRRYRRVAMHATRLDLLERQCERAGVPLRTMDIPYPCSNAEYERAFGEIIEQASAENVALMAFGDLHLDEVRAYREGLFGDSGIAPVFPLWGMNTRALARDMVASGLRAIVSCVDPEQLSPAFAGRTFDGAFLDELPDDVDPCGERGEFHTFVYDGPVFSHPIDVAVGEIVERDGFVFADVRMRDA